MGGGCEQGDRRGTAGGNRALLSNFRVREANIAALRSLLRFHYRAGEPATIARIIAAYERGTSARDDEPAAVLCVSYPVLNAPWRAHAWPELAGADAREINARVRCISRVVVDPRFRGIGLSSELVRRYLREPLTTHTESLAAMGCACPFLVAGGMQQLELPRSARDERLLRDLRALGAEPADLLGGARVIDHRTCRGRALRAALLRWAKSSKATARGAEKRTTADLLNDAGGALRPTRLVYVHTLSIGSVQTHGEGNR